MTDLTKALAVGRDDTRRFSVTLIDLKKAYNNALAADVDVVSAMWMNLSMDCAKVSNDLIPRADADLAVALMVEPLLKRREGIEADIRSAHHGRGDGASSAMREDDRDFRAAVAAAFDALTPASALAELQALRAERDDAVASQFITRVERDGAEDHATETADELRQVRARAEAAEAELAALRAQVERLTGLIQWAHDTLWELNPGNYGHDDVCKVNDAAVEVILGLAPIIGETHGHSVEWWEARAALTEGAAP